MSALAVAWSRSAPDGPTPDLAPGEVHLWWMARQSHAADTPFDALSREERARADRLVLPARRQAFALARTMLRAVLGSYLSLDPAKVPLATADGGKPYVPDQRLRFNLSHSADRMLLAVTDGCEVGVDLEPAEGTLDAAALAAVALSHDEVAALAALRAHDREGAVLRIWTRKESLLKAAASGLVCDPRCLTLPLVLPARMSHAGRVWTIADISLGAAWQASLSLEGSLGAVRGFLGRWTGRTLRMAV